MTFRPDPKKEPRPKKAKQPLRRVTPVKTGYNAKGEKIVPKKTVKKATGEWGAFMEIWSDRPHVSFISGRPIDEPKPGNFLHVLAKGLAKYPRFKLYKKNIVLGTNYEHFLVDDGNMELRAAYAEKCADEGYTCDWRKYFALRDELLEEYKQLKP